MKALSLWEPWAGLVAAGIKTVETRSWTTNHRGELAIAATAHAGGWTVWSDLPDDVRDAWPTSRRLAHGHVVATCTLVDVIPVDRIVWTSRWPGWRLIDRHGGARPFIAFDQRPLGDFTPGRYAWLLDNIHPLDPPVPARGRQQLWDWAA